jgi:hypothetical protein
MHRLSIAVVTLILVAGCSSGPAPERRAESPKLSETKMPSDESRRFPKANLTRTEVVRNNVWGKSFMPGGTVARYRKGATEYEIFIARMPTATDAAISLVDWRKAMTGAKLVPSFGGYFGADDGKPVFVFPKGEWLAGIRGLKEKEADAQARILATQLN